MSSQAVILKRADRLIWATILCVAGLVLAAGTIGPFQIVWMSFVKAAIACAALNAAGWYYLKLRSDPLPAAALICVAQVTSFAAVGAPLSYIAASAGLPLWDSIFIRWDQALGLDWAGLLRTMNAYPGAHLIFVAAYASFFVQSTVVAMALAMTGQGLRLRVFVLAFIAATLVTIAISAAMPAQGAWGHLGLTAADYPAIEPTTRDLHLAVLQGLRNGGFRSLMADGAEGIITFPSLHAALATLFIFALWPIRVLRWVALTVNLLMIASTPIDGGHYFCDAIAGIVIASLSWPLARRIVLAPSLRHAPLPVIVAPPVAPDRLPGKGRTRPLLDRADVC